MYSLYYEVAPYQNFIFSAMYGGSDLSPGSPAVNPCSGTRTRVGGGAVEDRPL